MYVLNIVDIPVTSITDYNLAFAGISVSSVSYWNLSETEDNNLFE